MDTSSEDTPLLKKKFQEPTPLPWLQISIVLLVQLCDPVASQSIYPYINQLISELDIVGGDEKKVGYYAGLIESLFFAVQALTVLYWSRLSDRVGRKPVMLVGLFGTAVSMLCFGLSRNFPTLIISRCLCGFLNGNIGNILGELTDRTNRARAFSWMPVMWAIGCTFGSLIGGTLSKPRERFPDIFGGVFWKEYPYFLPCLVTSCFAFLLFLALLVFFDETSTKPRRLVPGPPEEPSSGDNPALRELLTYPVVVSVANYMSLAFLDMAMVALVPLFFSMPLEIGGLGLDSPTIGYAMACYGILVGVFQVLFFAKIVSRIGERQVFFNGILCLLPAFLIFPLASFLAQHGETTMMFLCISVLLPLLANMEMSYSSINVYITASAPNKQSLGATNGLAQMAGSIVRTIGPGLATSLFSLSVEHNLLGGYAVYMIFSGLTCFAIWLALYLPVDVWQGDSDSQGSEGTIS